MNWPQKALVNRKKHWSYQNTAEKLNLRGALGIIQLLVLDTASVLGMMLVWSFKIMKERQLLWATFYVLCLLGEYLKRRYNNLWTSYAQKWKNGIMSLYAIVYEILIEVCIFNVMSVPLRFKGQIKVVRERNMESKSSKLVIYRQKWLQMCSLPLWGNAERKHTDNRCRCLFIALELYDLFHKSSKMLTYPSMYFYHSFLTQST